MEAAVSQAQNQTPEVQQAPFLLESGHAIAPDVEREGRYSQLILVMKMICCETVGGRTVKLTQRCFEAYL